MDQREATKKICLFLDIDLSKETFEDIIDELSNIEDAAVFLDFIKQVFNYDRFRYLKPYQKFIAIANEYKKLNKPKLNADEEMKVRSYSEKLFEKVTYVFDEIDYRTKIGMDIQDKRISVWLFNAFGEDKKALLVLEKIGKRSEILNKLRSNRNGLLNEIESIVYGLSMKSKYPQLENKDKDTHNRTETMLKQLKMKN